MAESSVYYYQDGSYSSSGSEDTRKSGDNQDRDPEKKPDIKVRHTEARSGSLLTIILISVLAAALLGSVIYSLDRRNTMYNKVSSLNNKLSLAEAENVRLQSKLESKISAKNVEDYAENVLGMQKIDSSQIEYIKIQTGDVVNIPEQEKGLMAKIKGLFESCVEYFRG
ncbi:MAG: hypothetical protein J6L05_00215 [Ruminococcus sp.]|nr:hypothetical protein [Ruminococcus sp.]